VVSLANLERSRFFPCLYGESKEDYEKSYGAQSEVDRLESPAVASHPLRL